MALAEKTIKIAEKSAEKSDKKDAEIKKLVSKKLNKRIHPSQSNPTADAMVAVAGIVYIVPVILYGLLVFISAGFKAAMEASIEMYNDRMKDAKKWAR